MTLPPVFPKLFRQPYGGEAKSSEIVALLHRIKVPEVQKRIHRKRRYAKQVGASDPRAGGEDDHSGPGSQAVRHRTSYRFELRVYRIYKYIYIYIYMVYMEYHMVYYMIHAKIVYTFRFRFHVKILYTSRSQSKRGAGGQNLS